LGFVHSVFKAWIFELPFRMQSVLNASLRGCDIARKDDPSKFVTRGLRTSILNNADPSNTFMGPIVPEEKHVKQFLWDLDRYPMHFIMHTAHAAEIVGFKHPDEAVRTWWLTFYQNVVKALHLTPETEAQLDVRLGYTPAEIEAIKADPELESYWNAVRDRPAHEAELKKAREEVAKALKRAEVAEQELAKLKKEHQWDAGTGTSHGGRGRPWSGGS